MSSVPYPKENLVKMVMYNLPRYTYRHRHNFDQNSLLYNEWKICWNWSLWILNHQQCTERVIYKFIKSMDWKQIASTFQKFDTYLMHIPNTLLPNQWKNIVMSCCRIKYFLHISNRIQCIVFVGTGSKLEPGFFNNYLRELSAFERFIFFSSTYFFNEENMKSTVTIYIYYLPIYDELHTSF